jgi:hypothetical protein
MVAKSNSGVYEELVLLAMEENHYSIAGVVSKLPLTKN